MSEISRRKSEHLDLCATRDVESARPTDPGMVARLGAAVDALSDGSARLLKDVRVLASGGSISLGYVSETPVWRASYRLVLADGAGESALQGWALVHNDTDEAWKRVQVELVNDGPVTFWVETKAGALVK